MDRTRTAQQGLGEAFGVGSAAHLPIAVRGGPGIARVSVPQDKRSVRSGVLGVLRNALVAVAFMALLPIGLVGTLGPHVWQSLDFERGVFARVKESDVVRPFMLPKDASITPMMAGVALHVLEEPGRTGPFLRPVAARERPWETTAITPEMFRTARPDVFEGPSPVRILEAGARGFSADEKAYLEKLAAAPIWRDFNLVARAQAVDVVGGRTVTPISSNATWAEYPIVTWRGPRELAYAAVSRAAWFESIGQRDSAEATLRAIVSVGFAAIDNGVTATDELVGNVIVGVGQNALARFYRLTNDPRAASAALAPVRTLTPAHVARRSPDVIRREWIARANDPAVPRAERIESLRILSLASCTSVRELMFGPRSDVTNAVAQAERTLSRYPAEGDLIRLSARLPRFQDGDLMSTPLQGIVASSASVVASLTGNPRLVTCSILVSSQRMGFP